MSQLNLRSVLSGDNIAQAVEKINYNFQQIVLNGGGPKGDTGIIGPPGIPGPEGPVGPSGSIGATGSYTYVGTTAPNSIVSFTPPTTLGDVYIQALTNSITFWQLTGTGATGWSNVASFATSNSILSVAADPGGTGPVYASGYISSTQASHFIVSDASSLGLTGQILDNSTTLAGWLSNSGGGSRKWTSIFGGLGGASGSQLRILNTDPRVTGPSASIGGINKRSPGMQISLKTNPYTTPTLQQVFSLESSKLDSGDDSDGYNWFYILPNKTTSGSPTLPFAINTSNKVSIGGDSSLGTGSVQNSINDNLTVFNSSLVYGATSSQFRVDTGATGISQIYLSRGASFSSPGGVGSTIGQWGLLLGYPDNALRLFGWVNGNTAKAMEFSISSSQVNGKNFPIVSVGGDAGSTGRLLVDSYSYLGLGATAIQRAPQVIIGLGATTGMAPFNFGSTAEGLGFQGITKAIEWVSGTGSGGGSTPIATGFRIIGSTASIASSDVATIQNFQYRSYGDVTWQNAISIISQNGATTSNGAYSGNVIIGSSTASTTIGKSKLTVIGNPNSSLFSVLTSTGATSMFIDQNNSSILLQSNSITLQNVTAGGQINIGNPSNSSLLGNVQVAATNFGVSGYTSIGFSSPLINVGNQSFPGALNEYYTTLTSSGATATVSGTSSVSLISSAGGNPNYLVLRTSDNSINMNAVSTMGLSSPYVQLGGAGGATGNVAMYAAKFNFGIDNYPILGGINTTNVDGGSSYVPSLLVKGYTSTVGSTAHIAITTQGSLVIDSSPYGVSSNEGLFFRNTSISSDKIPGVGNWGLQYWEPSESNNYTFEYVSYIYNGSPAVHAGQGFATIGILVSGPLTDGVHGFLSIGNQVTINDPNAPIGFGSNVFNVLAAGVHSSGKFYYSLSQSGWGPRNFGFTDRPFNLFIEYNNVFLQSNSGGQTYNLSSQTGLSFWKPGGTAGTLQDPQKGYLYLDDGGSIGIGTTQFEYSTAVPGTYNYTVLDHGIYWPTTVTDTLDPRYPSTGWDINTNHGHGDLNASTPYCTIPFNVPGGIFGDYVIEWHVGYPSVNDLYPTAARDTSLVYSWIYSIYNDGHKPYVYISNRTSTSFRLNFPNGGGNENILIYWTVKKNIDPYYLSPFSGDTGGQIYDNTGGNLGSPGAASTGNAKLAVNGSVLCQSIITTSDERLKDNIEDLTTEIEKIKLLHPSSFNIKETPNVKSLGFIAQDVAKIYPEMIRVFKDPELEGGKMTLDYLSFIPILTKGIQEQQDMIEDNDHRIKTLEQELEEIKNILYKNQIQ